MQMLNSNNYITVILILYCIEKYSKGTKWPCSKWDVMSNFIFKIKNTNCLPRRVKGNVVHRST